MDRVDYESIVVQDLINLQKKGELKLDPWYQRRSVWTHPQKAYLINSLMAQKPIPTCYVRHYLDIQEEKSIKEVVDGQQRLRAILEFLSDGFTTFHPSRKTRVKFSDLTPAERSKLKMTKLSIGYLINADEADVIDIFGRLNSVAKTLNDQEKRNARFSGLMKQFCLEIAAKKVHYWREAGVFTANDISRMLEVQFISDIVLNFLEGLSDFSAAKLDALYEGHEENFAAWRKIEARIERVFATLVALGPETIRETIFSRVPMFFSLLLVLDQRTRVLLTKRLDERLRDIDALFNDPDTPIGNRGKAEAEFYAASTASTQRIKSRRIRHKFLSKRIG